MNRREAIPALLAFCAAGAALPSVAQQMLRPWRIGFFSSASKGSRASEKAFLEGMKDYGYTLGRNLIVDARYADGDAARYPALADELIALKPDVLLVTSTGNAMVLKNKTTTIPIVLGSPGDPVADGLVRSLARPGSNITGNSLQLTELSAKQIELMAEVLPLMRRAALLIDLSQAKTANRRVEQLASTAATAKGIVLEVHRVDSFEAVRQMFPKLEKRRADALLLSPTPRFNVLRREICRRAESIRVPVVGFSHEWAQDGALLSFGPSWEAAYRRAAYFVDRILKGAEPGDLPIEQPTRFSLVVNARVAKALGIKIPSSVALRADRVIE